MNLLKDVRVYQNGGENSGYSRVSSGRFTEAFDANIIKANGHQLTLSEFRSDYHNLVN